MKSVEQNSGVPLVSVGILSAFTIDFVLNSTFVCEGIEYSGEQRVLLQDDKILWKGGLYDQLEFLPLTTALKSNEASFTLKEVIIGVGFHWERREDQTFRGSLKLIIEGDKITAVNLVDVEEYLISVISSEMSATASLELLKAHSVISRSWLFAQIEKRQKAVDNREVVHLEKRYNSEGCVEEYIKWYDGGDHLNFDICADDHCQRYQGITRASTTLASEAVESTRGVLLTYNGEICDARYSKCCGGMLERFESCWEEQEHPYLVAKRDISLKSDLIQQSEFTPYPNLTLEENAKRWILSSPESFCNSCDKDILSQVLNNYDRETVNFYRWRVEYRAEELSQLIFKRSGIDYGIIIDLIPVERGASGRIIKLKIVGSKRICIIGKELEIRRTLSESHLYSSAFVIEREFGAEGKCEKFILHGAGWGHGVGLCQIGAAVMGEKGFSFKEILSHYYVGASLESRY